MTLTEKVARALAQHDGHDPDKIVGDFNRHAAVNPDAIDFAISWNIVKDVFPKWFKWQEYETQARIAIEAMREPSEAMCEAGVEPLHGVFTHDLAEAWPRMIDEALRS